MPSLRELYRQRLDRIAEIIETVDQRCMAVDGPVTPTLQEMTQAELSEIYALATFREVVDTGKVVVSIRATLEVVTDPKAKPGLLQALKRGKFILLDRPTGKRK